MSWLDSAHAHIEKAYNTLRAENPDGSAASLLELINQHHYPFGECAMLPYKMWLKAMRVWKIKLGVPVKAETRTAKCGCSYKGGAIDSACDAHKGNWQMLF